MDVVRRPRRLEKILERRDLVVQRDNIFFTLKSFFLITVLDIGLLFTKTSRTLNLPKLNVRFSNVFGFIPKKNF